MHTKTFISRLSLLALSMGILFAFNPKKNNDINYVTLRVLTYNIYHGETSAGNIDMDLFGEIIDEQKPDIVALQEVDKNTARTGRIDITSELAIRTGLKGYFVKHRDFQGGEYGNAILSRFPVERIDVIDGYRTSSNPITFPFAKIEISKGIYIFFSSTHLSTNLEMRTEQTKQLVKYYTDSTNKAPTLICGDLNAEPDAPELSILFEKFDISDKEYNNTFSTRSGLRKKIDYILHPKDFNWEVIETRVICREDASDHCALLAVIKYNIPKKYK